MQVDLNNFFKYYDEKNPKHCAAVDELESSLNKLCPDLLEDSSNWIRIYRTKVVDNILNVPWYSQTDNYTLPDTTCNSSACAMCLEFLKPNSLPSGLKGDDSYLRKVLSIGPSTDHMIQTRVLESYGVKSAFYYNLGFEDLDRELSKGNPIVIGFLHKGSENNPSGGHMIVIIGKNSNGDYWVRDPYGSIYDGYSGPVENGREVLYSRKMLEKRWTVKHSKDGWGRLFQ
jgi:hypothetical protein